MSDKEVVGDSMERIKNRNRYQKGILILLVVMAILFTVLYSKATSREGFLYKDEIFVVSEESGNTIYSGKIRGEECKFLVTAEKTVTFQYGEKIYGPYAVKEESTAIPEDSTWSGQMTGVEVTAGEEILFRGGFLDLGNPGNIWLLVNEDGTDANSAFTTTMSDGITLDEDGNVVDPMEPSVKTILKLVAGPDLTHKGDWEVWFYAMLISVIIAVSILFADELFRFNLAFQIRDADYAEPSDWEIASRYIGWTITTILVFVAYLAGLQ